MKGEKREERKVDEEIVRKRRGTGKERREESGQYRFGISIFRRTRLEGFKIQASKGYTHRRSLRQALRLVCVSLHLQPRSFTFLYKEMSQKAVCTLSPLLTSG